MGSEPEESAGGRSGTPVVAAGLCAGPWEGTEAFPYDVLFSVLQDFLKNLRPSGKPRSLCQ